jgi:hypothetical protein
MFDVQVLSVRGRRLLPEPVLASIAGYYRRVTSGAHPMGRLVGLVMLATLAGALVELAVGEGSLARRMLPVALCGVPIALALARTLPNAVRLATRRDPPERQSALARAICRDHLLCLASIAGFLALELGAPH